MSKKTTPAATAGDQDEKKTAAADDKASGPTTPATGSEGEAKAEAGGAVVPSAGAETEPAAAGETGAAEMQQSSPQVASAAPVTDAPFDRAGWPAEIIVRGPEKGRWRAGRHFTAAPVPVPLADLTDDQLLSLRGDPELTLIGWQ